jgi:hypothetical protein
MPLLDSTRDEFAERNVPLCLLLGLVSLGRRLDGLLAKRGAPWQERQEPAGEHPLVFLILGLVSLRTKLAAELDPLLSTRRPRVVSPAPASPLIRDLLR